MSMISKCILQYLQKDSNEKMVRVVQKKKEKNQRGWCERVSMLARWKGEKREKGRRSFSSRGHSSQSTEPRLSSSCKKLISREPEVLSEGAAHVRQQVRKLNRLVCKSKMFHESTDIHHSVLRTHQQTKTIQVLTTAQQR